MHPKLTVLTDACSAPTLTADASARLQEACCDLLLESLSSVARKNVERWTARENSDDLRLAEDFLASVFTIKEADPATRNELLLHPTFRYWLQGLRRVSRGDEPERERAFMEAGPGFALGLEVLNGGFSKAWRTRTDYRGGLRLPLARTFVEFGADRANTAITIEGNGSSVKFVWDDGSAESIEKEVILERNGDGNGKTRVHIAPVVNGTEITCSARDEYLRVDYTGTNQRDTGVKFFGMRDDLYLDSPDLSIYNAAFQALKAVWPEQFADVQRFTSVIVPMIPQPGVYRAFTVSSRQGAIFLDQIPPESLVENIIHENAHIKLRQIELLGQLLTNPREDSQRFKVPWRPDPRPIPGIVEGIWVFSHVAEYRFRLWQKLGDSEMRDRYNRQLDDLLFARDLIAKNANFTENGKAYYAGVSTWIDELTCRAR